MRPQINSSRNPPFCFGERNKFFPYVIHCGEIHCCLQHEVCFLRSFLRILSMDGFLAKVSNEVNPDILMRASEVGGFGSELLLSYPWVMRSP